jgi:polysaccharide export outer membrane protein
MIRRPCRVRLCAALAFFLLAGCATGIQRKITQAEEEGRITRHADAQEIGVLNQSIMAAARPATDPGDVLLGPGDLLQVSVFEAPDLNAKVRVSARGHVTLPLLGQLTVKGLSAREAEVRIEELYRSTYLKDPHVTVFVEEHFSQRVTLIGQFKNPGTHDYPAKQRLLDVMALGGGLSDTAGRTLQVRRTGATPEESGTILVDLDQLIREGRTELNIEINGGDVVFVPEAGMFFVDGAVRRPGAFPIRQSTILLEAIAMAGGLAAYADTDTVLLVRHLGGGKRQVLELDLDDAAVQDTEVNDRDIILVKVSAMGQLVQGLGINIGIPGVAGIGYHDPVQ